MSKLSIKSILQILVLALSFVLFNGCSVSASNSETPASEPQNLPTVTGEEKTASATKNSTSAGKIKINEGSPADTVRIFYKNLRERRFKEAMMMTNLRPAVENLSDDEMQDLSSDFEPLAAQVPAQIQINGEIISGNQATITAKMPDNESGLMELTQIELRRESNVWIIITAGKEAESAARKEGKNYFFNLRIDTHHTEVERMMQQISKAQSIYALQYGGVFTDLPTLISASLLPEDINSAKSTGYRFVISVDGSKRKYFASAVPEVYGKTGKLSFLLESDGANQQARLKSADNKGQPLKK